MDKLKEDFLVSTTDWHKQISKWSSEQKEHQVDNFLVFNASSHLFQRMCPSVRRSVGRSWVGPSVRGSVHRSVRRSVRGSVRGSVRRSVTH